LKLKDHQSDRQVKELVAMPPHREFCATKHPPGLFYFTEEKQEMQLRFPKPLIKGDFIMQSLTKVSVF
jgi:hypothetical protein